MRGPLLKLFRRRRLESDLQAELEFHREMAAAHDNPIGLGNPSVIKEQALDLWRFTFIENIWRDIRYAIRSLSRSPGFVLSALLSLGLGIGVNTAMFSIATEFLLSKPSVADAQSWVSIYLGDSNHARQNAVDFLDKSGVFRDVAGENWESFSNWNDGQETRRIFTVQTTKNYFAVLGIPVALGRGWTVNDPGQVVVLCYRFWQKYFHGDPSVIGRSIDLDGRAFTVIGVLPASHRTLIGYGFSPDIYLPSYLPDTLFEIYARLKPGMSLGEARAAVRTVAERMDRSKLNPYKKYASGLRVMPLAGFARLKQEQATTPIGLFFVVLLALVTLVFVIACVNTAGLLLVRASNRRQEMAVRLSLGANRGRLIQQLLVESLLLSLSGGGAGFVIAQLMARLLASIRLPVPMPIRLQIEPDWRVAAYAAGLAVTAAVICGLFRAWQSFQEVLTPDLHSQRRLGIRRVLVTAQIAVSVIVLATGSLFLRNLWLARSIDPGFDTRNTLRAEVYLPPIRYRDEALQKSYFAATLRELAAIPGIEAAAAARIIPFTEESHERVDFTFSKTGHKKTVRFHSNAVSPDFFRAMGIPLLAGHVFTVADDGGPRVVIVNKNFVDRYLDGRPAVDATFRWGGGNILYRIAGVVGGTKNMTIGEEDQPQLYRPLAQAVNGRPQIQFVLRSAIPPASQLEAVRRVLRRIEPEAGTEVSTMYASIGLAFLPSQIGAALMGGAAILGLLLAAIGLYGVTAYAVARRTREIGIRMAIGATRTQIVRFALMESVQMLMAGAAAGFLLAFFVTRPLAIFFVPGLGPSDPWSYAAVVLFLSLSAVAATAGPVRRALRVDPAQSLRYE
ncbi:MAG TPA: ADOP family duplicated permease [Bryobacteraceae bacterium]